MGAADDNVVQEAVWSHEVWVFAREGEGGGMCMCMCVC